LSVYLAGITSDGGANDDAIPSDAGAGGASPNGGGANPNAFCASPNADDGASASAGASARVGPSELVRARDDRLRPD
jgi:hypothetical protein